MGFNKQPEEKTRHELINPSLRSAGWDVQDFKTASVNNSKGVAVEYFQMGQSVGEADYVLFVNSVAVGIIEASLEKAERLRKSILKSAFEGKLVKMDGEMERLK